MNEVGKIEVGGLKVWKEIKDIPGVTKVPVNEIAEFFAGETKDLLGLDVGSGSGRSTQLLQSAFRESKIVPFDLSLKGLSQMQSADKIQARAEEIPFPKDKFDFVNLCGVMTNLVDRKPEAAVQLRRKVIESLHRVLKPGGCLTISDFGANHFFDNYHVNYERHALITGEKGTIAVLRSGENFIGKTNTEIAAMRGTEEVIRYAHHYTTQELIDLVAFEGLRVRKCQVELALTPVGKRPIENLIVVAEKPETKEEETNLGSDRLFRH